MMKKTHGFKVLINDKTICRAGIEKDNGIVTFILDSIRRKSDDLEELNLSISGLNSDTNQQLKWYDNTLKEGDIISIEIILENFDDPSSINDRTNGL